MRIHEGKTWSRLGVIVGIHEDPRSYIVRTDKGTVIRRNRRDLLKIPNNGKTVIKQDAYPDIETSVEVRNNINDNNNMSPRVINVPITRSGRRVVRPAYLNDYI